jgi:large subunit ribosomal protein L21
MFTRSVRSSLLSQKWPISPSTNAYSRAFVMTDSYTPQMPINTINTGKFTNASETTSSSTPPKPLFYPRHPALPSRPPPAQTAPFQDADLDSSVTNLLPLLRSQPPFHSTILIHGKPYLVTEGDTVRLPFLMQGVEAGDVLRFNRVSSIGSRDYTLKAGSMETRGEKTKCLDERLFVIRGRIMGTVVEPERMKLWHVKRRRHKKHIWSQHKFTVLKITELTVCHDVDLAQKQD